MNSLKYAKMAITPAVLFKMAILNHIDIKPSEIIQLFNEGVASVKSGETSEEEAVDIMTRYILSCPTVEDKDVLEQERREDEQLRTTAAAAASFALAATSPVVTGEVEGLAVNSDRSKPISSLMKEL